MAERYESQTTGAARSCFVGISQTLCQVGWNVGGH